MSDIPWGLAGLVLKLEETLNTFGMPAEGLAGPSDTTRGAWGYVMDQPVELRGLDVKRDVTLAVLLLIPKCQDKC